MRSFDTVQMLVYLTASYNVMQISSMKNNGDNLYCKCCYLHATLTDRDLQKMVRRLLYIFKDVSAYIYIYIYIYIFRHIFDSRLLIKTNQTTIQCNNILQLNNSTIPFPTIFHLSGINSKTYSVTILTKNKKQFDCSKKYANV